MTIKKGRILRADQFIWNGTDKTASREDSTGGTVSGLRIGVEVDVLQAYGDGDTYTLDVINKAITNIGSDNVTLVFNPGTWTIDDDVTIAANFVCRIPAGCVFNVSSGKTLTFSGPVIQDHATFSSGAGTVTTNGTRTVNGSQTVSGNTTTTGNNTTTGTSTLTGNVTAGGTLAVTGNTTVGGTLVTTGTSGSAAGTTTGHNPTIDQIQKTSTITATGGGTVSAITATLAPAISLSNGTTVFIRSVGANTSATPSFAPNGLTAKTIVKGSNAALNLGDIGGTSHELILRYNSSLDKWTLLNPIASSFRGALVKDAANHTLSDSTFTVLTFDTEAYDTDTIHDTVTNSSRLTVPSGVTKVRVTGMVSWSANATGIRYSYIYINNSPSYTGRGAIHQDGSSTSQLDQAISTAIVEVTSGDYFELFSYQSSGGNLDVLSSTWLAMEIIE